MPLTKKVWEIMDSEVHTISQDASVGEAIKEYMEIQAREPEFRALMAVGEDNTFKGSVTKRVVLKRMKSAFDDSCREGEEQLMDRFTRRCRQETDKKVRDIMLKNVRVSPSASVMEALNLFLDKNVDVLPVVDGNKPIGTLTLWTLFHLMKEFMRG